MQANRVTLNSTKLVFRFENRRCTLLPCVVFSVPPVPSESSEFAGCSPSIVYLDASDIQRARRDSLQGLYKPRFSFPTWALYTLRLSQLTPTNPRRDPYVTALLIAIAQEKRRAMRRRARSPPLNGQSFRVHVLLSDAANKSHIFVYTADIAESFLNKLDHPRVRPRDAPSVPVQTYTIPYEPYASLQQRLIYAMFPRGQKRARELDDDGGR
ncbi:hypothetical protein ColLi_11419 [Colletotrichum liriopes]|uniref:Uncharacterized protein n=1 Tax=Colletotrichum liriopes TaxID=708192 RepID=A0AA37GY76_9PEZI|nr:hypothetical protein ColLi_11419 [Colletotrichum liriopes]